MPIDDPLRGEAMGRRVVRTARASGVGATGLEAIARAHDAARARREALLDDDHDPHYLHPGRTALILLLDTGETDPAVLAAATLAESERPELAAADEAVLAPHSRPAGAPADGDPSGRAGPAARDILERALELRARVPRRDDPEVVEKLVVDEPALGLLAVAERLDHARHAHMWIEGAEHARLLSEFERHWDGLAERVHPRLAQRFRRWARGTRRRLDT